MFEQALTSVLGFEGGYSNDPHDPGGATNFGITQNVYDGYRSSHSLPKQSVREISNSEVSAIYRQNYWIEGGCDQIDLVDPFLALVHFDDCVNTGIGQAARILQRCVGAYPDGSIGPKSVAQIKDRVSKNRQAVRVSYLAARMDFYLDLVLSRSVLRVFLPSWMRRIQKLMELMATYD